MAAEVVPQIFDAVEFRRVWRQWDQRDVCGDHEVARAVEAGSVPDQSGVDVGGQRAGELVEELVDDRRVQDRCEDGFGLTGLWTRSTDDPEVFVFGLPHGGGARAAFGPHAGQRALLTEAALILKEGDDSLVGMFGLNASPLFGDFF